MKAKTRKTKPEVKSPKPARKPKAPPVLCEECEDPIPPARLQLIHTTLCVECMEFREREGTGTVRHRMTFEVIGDDDVEEVNLHLIRAAE